MKTNLFVIAFGVLSLFVLSDSAKILGLFITFSKSHLIIHKAVMQTLIDRGHDVTIVTSMPLPGPKDGFRHIQVDATPPDPEFVSSLTHGSIFPILYRLVNFSFEYNNQSMNDPKMKKLMAEDSFDLVVFGFFLNTFQIGVATHFKCPIVVVFMQRPVNLLNDMIGNPKYPFVVPHLAVASSQPLGFIDRVKNVLATVFIDFGMFKYIEYHMEKYYDYHFPSDKYPSYKDMFNNVSLFLSSYHFSNGIVRPSVPAFVEIGGIQVKPQSDPLPEDIQNFLDGASKHGAVYFSLGSNARSADLRPDTIQTVYNVLAGLKQRVIWKWEEDKTPGNASNIFFDKWLPQDDILAHPNTKLFITHAGHGGVVEAEYHGVPMVGIPLFADQFSNMNAVENAGYGISLNKDEITAEKFEWTVKEVLQNPSYRNKVQEFSRLYRDRPMTARDTAAYWMEYVIRHRGAKHMQSPAVHMNFMEYYGIDVFGFLFVVAYIVFKVLNFVFKKTARLICGSKSKKNFRDEMKKQN